VEELHYIMLHIIIVGCSNQEGRIAVFWEETPCSLLEVSPILVIVAPSSTEMLVHIYQDYTTRHPISTATFIIVTVRTPKSGVKDNWMNGTYV
jgi:hypothetical protein